MPDGIDSLLTLAEISVTLAGFSAVVVLFQRSDGGRWQASKADRFEGMVVHSMFAVLFCLLPIAMALAVDADATNWRICSAMLGVQIVGHVIGVARFPTTKRQEAAVMSIGLVPAAVLFANVAGLFADPFLAYVVGILWHICQAGLLFMMLIWIPPELIDRDT